MATEDTEATEVREVREAMSAVVLSIGPSHTLREAAQRMTERGVGSAVINDPDAMGPGLIAERDIVAAWEPLAQKAHSVPA